MPVPGHLDRGQYPFSAHDGSQIRLDVRRPLATLVVPFAANTLQTFTLASKSIPDKQRGADLRRYKVAEFQADQWIALGFDEIIDPSNAPGVVQEGTYWLRPNLIIELEIPEFTVKILSEASGTLTVNFLYVWQAFGTASRLEHG